VNLIVRGDQITQFDVDCIVIMHSIEVHCIGQMILTGLRQNGNDGVVSQIVGGVVPEHDVRAEAEGGIVLSVVGRGVSVDWVLRMWDKADFLDLFEWLHGVCFSHRVLQRYRRNRRSRKSVPFRFSCNLLV
jgi:hypothetical protein